MQISGCAKHFERQGIDKETPEYTDDEKKKLTLDHVSGFLLTVSLLTE